MLQQTKRERIQQVLKIMKQNSGVKKTIGGWLDDINKDLNEKRSFNSTRELAQAFRYIKHTLKQDIIKSKEVNNVYYTLNPKLEINQIQPIEVSHG